MVMSLYKIYKIFVLCFCRGVIPLVVYRFVKNTYYLKIFMNNDGLTEIYWDLLVLRHGDKLTIEWLTLTCVATKKTEPVTWKNSSGSNVFLRNIFVCLCWLYCCLCWYTISFQDSNFMILHGMGKHFYCRLVVDFVVWKIWSLSKAFFH